MVAVAGDPADPQTFYFGGCAGGVWKSTDGGVYWKNISDGFFNSSSIGAIAIADSDPSIIYAGTGEACIRSNVSHGDGVYKSIDSGKTWVNIGLGDSRHISRIRIDPEDPDKVYVAALGHAFGPNKSRGIFRSMDGGKNWEHVLFKSERAGAIDLSMDPTNPQILYTAIWQALRTPWSMTSGGPDSGLWRSTNGGDTWTDLTNKPGIPKGIKGRIGVAVSPAKQGRVWAIVEAEDGVLVRSDNGGDSWEKVNDSPIVRQRPFYHHHIFAHPSEPDTMWTLPIQAWKSEDGGSTFKMMTTPHSDNHDLWIDPKNPDRMIEGNDGGACVSFNGGNTWSTIYNQPTAQFYHVTTDTRSPYRIYGTQQDNSAISTPSRSNKGAIPLRDSYVVGPSESGYIEVSPDNPNLVYSGAIGSAPGGGGALLRYNHDTGESRIITVWPEISYGLGAKDMKYRFQWTFPIVISPHDSKTLYVTANHVFRSVDEGTTWEKISPDLTRNDPNKGNPGGDPISRDVSGAEVYCTIFSFAESSHEQGVFWTGSDDGLVYISRDSGTSWNNITPDSLPEWATVSMIDLSDHEPDTAYVAAWNYKLNDYSPYLFRTQNGGETWESINSGIPDQEFVRVVREDPDCSGLLYAGTEKGVYTSLDRGESWHSLQINLPNTPIHDLVIKDGDLIAATHGRSFWILDDITPLRYLKQTRLEEPVYLLKPRPVYRPLTTLGEITPERIGPGKNYWIAIGTEATFEDNEAADGTQTRTFLDAGHNPPSGATISYNLKQGSSSKDVKITILDAEQSTVTKVTGLPAEAGMNRFIWDMRHPGPVEAPGDSDSFLIAGPSPKGPLVTPGNYTIKLELEGKVSTQILKVLKDPKSEATDADLDKQLELLIHIRDKLSETNETINKLRSNRSRLQKYLANTDGVSEKSNITATGLGIIKSLDAMESSLISTWDTSERGQMGTPLPKLVDALAALVTVVESADSSPTLSSYAVFENLSHSISDTINQIDQLICKDVENLIGKGN